MDGTSSRTTLSLIGVAALLALVAFAAMRAFPAAEAWLTDFRTALLSPAPAGQDARIVVVAITEDTLAQLPYRSPVDRGFLADLVTVVDAAGPRAIGFDILFDQASEPAKDEALVTALRDAAAPAVLGVVAGDSALTEAQRGFLAAFVEAAGAIPGYVDLPTDGDGAIRRRPDVVAPGRDSLGTALVRAAGGDAPAFGGMLALRQPGPDTPPIAQLPAHLILQMGAVQPAVVAGWLADRIVLIGADLPFDDRHRAALALRAGEPLRTAGVLIHAHAMSQALDGLRKRAIFRLHDKVKNAAMLTATEAVIEAFVFVDGEGGCLLIVEWTEPHMFAALLLQPHAPPHHGNKPRPIPDFI